ncbi:MAG TPA: hypothetical protein VL651_12930 [Bacteroidia bacterium]|jgi:hypothetical protein|nr:hypothetical protein [Bacteroidia bacterium]
MKTLATILTATLLFTAQIGNAQRYAVDGNAPSIHSRIVSSVKVPDALKNSDNTESEKVRVLFTIDELGKAHIVEINSDRADIIQDVKQQIESIDFSGSEYSILEQYSIFLTFKFV